MVADTKEKKMTDMFEAMTKNARAALDTGRRMQDGWFDSLAHFNGRDNTQKNAVGEPARMVKDWMTLLCDNWQSFGDAAQTCFQANMDVVKVAAEMPTTLCEGDVYDSQRKVMDSAFQAFQKNIDTMNQVGKATTDCWTSFTKASSCCDAGAPKVSGKNGK